VWTMDHASDNARHELRQLGELYVSAVGQSPPPEAPRTPQAGEGLLHDEERLLPAGLVAPHGTPIAETLWCCSSALETALFRLCKLDRAPMMRLVRRAMRRSARDVSYFITDTAAYIVSKMWDDMLASEIFHTSSTFLCQAEYGRPCTPPAAAIIQ